MQEIHLDLPHENFFCPVTGSLIRNDELYEPSAATVFTYLDELGDFNDIQPKYEAIYESIATDEDDFSDDRFEKFRQRVSDDSIICFTIMTHGMACGPVSSTVRIGIDMNYSAETADE